MSNSSVCCPGTCPFGLRHIRLESGAGLVVVGNATPAPYLTDLVFSLLSVTAPAGFLQQWSGLGPAATSTATLTQIGDATPIGIDTSADVTTVTLQFTLGGAVVSSTPLVVTLIALSIGSSGFVTVTGASTAGATVVIGVSYVYVASARSQVWNITGVSVEIS